MDTMKIKHPRSLDVDPASIIQNFARSSHSQSWDASWINVQNLRGGSGELFQRSNPGWDLTMAGSDTISTRAEAALVPIPGSETQRHSGRGKAAAGGECFALAEKSIFPSFIMAVM